MWIHTQVIQQSLDSRAIRMFSDVQFVRSNHVPKPETLNCLPSTDEDGHWEEPIKIE